MKWPINFPKLLSKKVRKDIGLENPPESGCKESKLSTSNYSGLVSDVLSKIFYVVEHLLVGKIRRQMEEIIERILSHPLLIVCLSLVCLLLLFSILKGLLKLALCALIAAGLFIGYLHYFQEDYPLPAIDVEKLDGLKDNILKYIPSELNSTLDLNFSMPDKNSTLVPRSP